MKAIERFQIKKIYAIGSALGIKGAGTKEDELHILVEGLTGKESIKCLTYKEACTVIARLEELQGKAASPKAKYGRQSGNKGRPGGVSTGQQKKIWALMYELKEYDKLPNEVSLGARLCAVIKKELHTDASIKTPFAWLSFSDGNKLIEILKQYVANAAKKSGV